MSEKIKQLKFSLIKICLAFYFIFNKAPLNLIDTKKGKINKVNIQQEQR